MSRLSPFLPLVAPGLLVFEVILVALRFRNIITWRWWMMTPLWLGAVIFVFEAAAFVTAVTVVRDLLRWVLP
jgi:hypothetical protein